MKISTSYLSVLALILLFQGACGGLSGSLRQEGDHQDESSRDQSDLSKSVDSESSSARDPLNVGKLPYQKGLRATREDFVDDSQDEGSLWASSGQTNYYFTKNRVKNPGELITVTVEPDLYRDICLEIRSHLMRIERDLEVSELKEQMRVKLAHPSENETMNPSAMTPERALSQSGSSPSPASTPSTSPIAKTSANSISYTPRSPEEIERLVSQISISDVNIQPSLDLKSGDSLSGEIIERFPNGNFKIKVMKRVPYKKGKPRLVRLVGIVKSGDLNEDTDLVSSGKIYDYHLEVSH